MNEAIRSSSFANALEEAEVLAEAVDAETGELLDDESLFAKYFKDLDRPEDLSAYLVDREIIGSILVDEEAETAPEIMNRINLLADELGVSAISLLNAIVDLAMEMDGKKDQNNIE